MSRTLLLLAAIIGATYCQTYGDGTVHAEFNVQCDDTHFAVFFNKTALDERTVANYNNRSYVIRFYGQDSLSCWTHDYETLKASATYNSLSSGVSYASTIHLGTPFGVSQCGVNVFSDATHIMYNTTLVVTYGANPSGNIGREEYDKYNVMCLRNRTIYEKLSGDKYDVEYRKTGMDSQNDTADFAFALTHTDMNNNAQSTYKLGDFIKFRMASQTARTEVRAVVQKCWSTSDGSANEYALISNRCDMEQGTSFTIAPTDTDTYFKTEAFRYLNVAGQAVHVECLVRVCLDTDGAAECGLCPFSGRKRREITDEKTTVGQMAVVKSPVFYIVDERATSDKSSSGPLSGTNGLIVIILLATLVFVIAAAIVKKVFFSAAAAPVAVTAYQNKAMA